MGGATAPRRAIIRFCARPFGECRASSKRLRLDRNRRRPPDAVLPALSIPLPGRGRGKFRFVVDGDQPAAVLLRHHPVEKAFPERNVHV
jgi:hypothetical protein